MDNKSKNSLMGYLQKNISLMKINNIILVLRTRIILLSSFMIYFFYVCHSGSFPIIFLNKLRIFHLEACLIFKNKMDAWAFVFDGEEGLLHILRLHILRP